MMTYVIFAGDMLVMAFMIGLVIWVSVFTSDEQIDAIARLPLDDEEVRERPILARPPSKPGPDTDG